MKNRNGRTSMSPRIPMKTSILAASIALALAQMSTPVMADSGTGQDTVMGNALNTRPINNTTHGAAPDPDGIGAGYEAVAHTPTGQMYDRPLLPNEPAGDSGLRGFVEAGALATDGDTHAHGFRRYKDVNDGLYLNSFGLSMEKKDSAAYFDLNGGAVGMDDQFYSAQFGRYNDWRVKAFYNETPHVFTTTYRAIHNGIGTGNLTLKPGLTPGGTAASALGMQTDNAAVAAVANANAGTELGLVRSKAGVRLDLNLIDGLKVFTSYTNEKRKGERPFGSVMGTPGGFPLEIVEPIDYTSHDFLAGLQYADDLNALNVQVMASWFRNNIDTLTFQWPYAQNTTGAAVNGVAATGFTQGRFDLYPDNDYYNIKGEYARRLPSLYNGRFTASMAYATSRQDDNLIPYTTLNGVVYTNANTTTNWNTTDSLSRTSADARIDTKLINLGLTLSPTNDLNVGGKVRYYETKNYTEYLACNPNATYTTDPDLTTPGVQTRLSAYGCSGVWGRLYADGAGATFAFQNGNANIRNIPFDYKQLIYGLNGDYRINRTNSLNLSYERENFDRDHREREKTWEDKVKLTLVNRDVGDGSLRLSGDVGRRRGSHYDVHHPYEAFYSGELIAMPTAGAVQNWAVHMNSGMRKYDISDRDQVIINARFNYMLRPDLDLGVMGQIKDAKYPDSMFGRTDKQTQNSLNFDLSYNPSAERNLYAFYSYQEGKIKQKGNVSGAIGAGTLAGATAVLGCTIGTVTPLGTITAENAAEICQSSYSNAVWLLANGWSVTHKDTSDTIGFGWKEMIGSNKFDINYTFAKSKTAIGYTPAGGTTIAAAAIAGDGMPDLKTTQHILEASLTVPISKTVSSRVLFRHEIGKIEDWHYYGLQTTPVAVNLPAAATTPTAVILDAGPQDYRASLLGVLFTFKL